VIRTPGSSRVIGVVTAMCMLQAAAASAGATPTATRSLQDSAPTLYLRVAVTPQIAQQRGWYRDFQCATLRASNILESALGRELRIRDRVTWNEPADVASLRDLRSQLIRTIDHGGSDLVVGILPGLTARSAAMTRIQEDGLAAYSQGYLVLRAGTPLCDAGSLLAHEIAHIFGGIHRRGVDNLMDPLSPGTKVDELNAALFDLHRERLIRLQEPPLRGEMLRMMWRLTRADLGAADTWLKVGVLAATMGRTEVACEHYQRALSIDPRHRTAWVNLGHARLQQERFDAAERAYNAALDLQADDGAVHNNLSVIYLSTGRPDRAKASMERALELGYDVPEGLRRAIRESIGGDRG
jgi:tetratricopeptide (TPR) repeat protein